jgi:hypothetical protein
MKLKLATIILLLCSCNALHIVKWNETLKTTDKNFSALSKEKGMKYAFLHFIDNNGVLLKPNSYPVEGKQTNQLLQSINDTSFQLTWEPLFARSSARGDLGYTYGIYTNTSNNTTKQGTYVTIWKKQKDGLWKFVLDSGNEGLTKPSH